MKSKVFYLSIITMFVLSIGILVSCATIVGKGGSENLNIQSTPDQATVIITDQTGAKIFEGRTPTIVPLEKSNGFFSGKKYTVKITKAGYADRKVVVDTHPNGWYIGGNLIFGGLIGWLIVDPATGAMWTLDTEKINLTLTESKSGSMLLPNKSGILLLNDVPMTLRDQMVRIFR